MPSPTRRTVCPRRASALLAVLAVSLSCGDATGPIAGWPTERPPDRPPRAASVIVTPARPELYPGQAVQLGALVRDSAGNALPGRVVTWRSGDSSVAAVSASGLVTAAAVGATSVVATSESVSDSVLVAVVPVPVATVQVTPASVELLVGEERQLSAAAADSAGSILPGRAIAWASSDATVATVDAGGAVRALTAGSASITATSGGREGRTSVTVRPVPVASVSVSPTLDTLDIGESGQLVAVTRDSAGHVLAGRPVAWESSRPDLVAVSVSGTATALASGEATVTATSEGVRATARVIVPRRPAPEDTVLVVTFGDSNTDFGYDGTDPQVRAFSYVSFSLGRPLAGAPNSGFQLAGKIERRWSATSPTPIRVVNHGIGGTSTGGGTFGAPNRTDVGAPQARTAVDGVTRFEAEVLGRAYPWSGGEPSGPGTNYPNGPIRRVNAFSPHANAFAYVSLGTNDPAYGMAPTATLANLAWMVDSWIASGRRADHLIITTLAPAKSSTAMPQLNRGIRALVERTGVGIIDLATHASPDDGLTWRSTELHVGDAVHYSETVRDWLAGEVVTYVRSRVPATP